MSILSTSSEDRGREWEPEPLQLPLVNPGESRLPRKAPLPYGDDPPDEDDDDRRNRVVVIDLA